MSFRMPLLDNDFVPKAIMRSKRIALEECGRMAHRLGQPAPALRQVPEELALQTMSKASYKQGRGMPTELRAWHEAEILTKARKAAPADEETKRHTRTKTQEEVLLALSQADMGNMSDKELKLVGYIGVIADERHDGGAREVMADNLGISIEGLTPLEAACRILAYRAG